MANTEEYVIKITWEYSDNQRTKTNIYISEPPYWIPGSLNVRILDVPCDLALQ